LFNRGETFVAVACPIYPVKPSLPLFNWAEFFFMPFMNFMVKKLPKATQSRNGQNHNKPSLTPALL